MSSIKHIKSIKQNFTIPANANMNSINPAFDFCTNNSMNMTNEYYKRISVLWRYREWKHYFEYNREI